MRTEYNREGQEPRISLNKLPSFVWGNPVQKESIVRAQKYPKAGGAGRYSEAEQAIARYFASDQDLSVLDEEIDKLVKLQQLVKGTYRPDCILALKKFRSFAPLDLKNAIVHSVPPRNSHAGMDIQGVFVSMRPDALLVAETPKGQAVGAIKLYFPRLDSNALGKEKSECISTVLSMFLERDKNSVGIADPKLCFSTDVFRETIYSGPRAHKRMMSYVEAACREYARMWAAC